MKSVFANLAVILLWIFIVKGEDLLLEYDLTIEERIIKHGYPVRSHLIETDDGYCNSLYNIPYGLNGKHKDTKDKANVLIAHGMGGSPQNFVLLGTERSAPYVFADSGLNTWVFAARGSDGSFSKKHKTLDWNKDVMYWNYSLHELGKYDLAAAVDFIYNQTGKKVAVIGHSAGGNEIYILLSERPEYFDKVSVGIHWGSAPIIRLLQYPAWLLPSLLVDVWKAIAKFANFIELPPLYQFKPLFKRMCADPNWQMACRTVSGVIGSRKSRLEEPDVIRLLTSNLPRLSSKMPFQFCDNVIDATFAQYNYGTKGNLKHYGQKTPPKYRLNNTMTPMAFFIGPGDRAIPREDVCLGVQLSANPILTYDVPFSTFTHMDYITGHNASELVYKPTYELIRDIEIGNFTKNVTC